MTINLRQTTAKGNLIAYANKQRELVIDNLVTQHWNYNLEICAAFEMMKERVLNIPRTTKELIELGKFIDQLLQV
ncbi:hypothetical protein ALC56_06325 [Trachymyrmex septentrionalis]|uniref:Uncharacterized protein n=1 Tax=Trachymyrmex septentrionalis TaxID=34720 RepID=A0A151JXD8_9HYME|nr:hypothetical protein ALC56_06325 [Trachymyrmex septentrionalis]